MWRNNGAIQWRNDEKKQGAKLYCTGAKRQRREVTMRRSKVKIWSSKVTMWWCKEVKEQRSDAAKKQWRERSSKDMQWKRDVAKKQCSKGVMQRRFLNEYYFESKLMFQTYCLFKLIWSYAVHIWQFTRGEMVKKDMHENYINPQ